MLPVCVCVRHIQLFILIFYLYFYIKTSVNCYILCILFNSVCC